MVHVNFHIDADGLIRDNCEWLRLPAQMRTRPAFHLQNIIAWRQLSTIVSVLVRSNARDFFFAVAAQDDQWIVSIVFHRHRRRVFIGHVDRIGRKNLYVSLNYS